jgi:hypothetical protein
MSDRPTWDQPGADPLADIREFIELGRKHGVGPDVGAPLVLGKRVAEVIEKKLGRPMTVDDIPPGVPGRWTHIEVAEPLPLHRTEAGYPHCSTCDGGGCSDCTDPA